MNKRTHSGNRITKLSQGLLTLMLLLMLSMGHASASNSIVYGGEDLGQYQEAVVQPNLPLDSFLGPRPYELEWSGRKESPAAQVAFNDLSGWRLFVRGNSQVSLLATMEQRLFRYQCAKFTYTAGKGDVSAVICPPAPILLDGRFDAVNLWVCDGNDRYFRNDDNKTPSVIANLIDSAGQEFRVRLGELGSAYWDIKHGILTDDQLASAKFPMSFCSLELKDWDVSGGRFIYLESIAFYEQNRKHKSYLPTGKQPFPANDNGMLPTPPVEAKTSVERVGAGADFACEASGGILRYHVQPEEGVLNGVSVQWNDKTPFRPMDGGSIKIDSGAEPALTADQMGKIRSREEMNTAEAMKSLYAENVIRLNPSDGKVISARLDGDKLVVQWRYEGLDRPVEWQASYWINGRTLVVDVSSTGGMAEGLQLGEVAGLPKPRRFPVPYFVLGRNSNTLVGPLFACGDGLFVSVLPDIFHSDLSDLDVKPSPLGEGDRIGLIGGTSYERLTDGRRNDMHDRIMVSVSPKFEEILPNSPAPPSPNRERLAPYMFSLTYDSPGDDNLYRTFKRYGMDYVIGNTFSQYCDYGATNTNCLANTVWNDGSRWRPRPPMTIETLQHHKKVLNDLGYLYGAYLYTVGIYPYNEFFDENDIALEQSGEWMSSIESQIGVKMGATIDLTRLTGKKINESCKPDAVYLDIGSTISVGVYDYEAGAEGAGIARYNLLTHGDSILETRKWCGPVICEGYMRWLYGGLSDIDFASMVYYTPPTEDRDYYGLSPAYTTSTTSPASHPLLYNLAPNYTTSTTSPASYPPLVDFDLLKIHPRALATMMGFATKMFLNPEELAVLDKDDGRGPAPVGFYKWVSDSLAYGHMACVGYEYVPTLNRCLQIYNLMEGVQREYLPDTAAKIEYNNGDQFLSTSQALLENSQKMGRVRVTYSKGLVVYVNYNPKLNWTVTESGRSYELPPYGWLAVKPGEILSYSALVNGSRVDYTQCPRYIYMNSNGALASEGGIEIQGAVLLKHETDGWRLIPCGDLGPWEKFLVPEYPKLKDYRVSNIPNDRGCAHIALDTQALFGKPASEVRIQGRDESYGATAADFKVVDASHVEIAASSNVADYLIK